MKRFVRSFALLSLLLLLPHCPPARTPEPIEEPVPSDAATLPVALGDAAAPRDDDASLEDAAASSDGSVGLADAASNPPNPICTEKVLGQTLNSGRCGSDAECQLGTQGCCAPCGQIPPDRLRAVSIHDGLNCAGRGCPKCASTLPEGFAARCLSRRCSVVQTTCEQPSACAKVRKPKVLPGVLEVTLAGCQRDAECALAAKNCCYCGFASDGELVAFSRRTRYQCAGNHNCPDCVTSGADPAFSAVCVSGRCRVKDTGLDSECLQDLRAP